MAYRHYETEGLVLGHTSHGEANRLYKILSPDFGLIMVLAQGVRLEKSKLRYKLQNYHLVQLSLVRGKEYWRLTGAEREAVANRNQVAFSHKISLVLLRLIHGEESSDYIFSDLKQAWGLLAKESLERGESKLKDLEIFILIRLLFNLGYLATSPLVEPILSIILFSWEELNYVEAKRLALINIINSSFLSSGL